MAHRKRNDRIRVVYCLDNMDVGGTELNAVRTAERLDRSRFDLSVVCFRDEGPLRARYEAAGIPVRLLALRSLHDAHAIRTGIGFRRFLRDERIDIVHSHDMYSNPFVTPWARAARTPVAIASRRWWQTLPSAKLRIANALAFRMAHCVLANSPAVADSVERVERIPRKRVAVVSNFVDDGAFGTVDGERAAALRAEWIGGGGGGGVTVGELVVGCVARLVPVKNQALLLEAVARLRQKGVKLRVVLIGGGPMRPALEERARNLGIATVVHFTGERIEPINFHQLFDLSVLCSQSEGFPNSIVEAMAAGRPVVATRIGGNVDAVRDGETGFLVPVGDVAALADAIERLARDPELRARQGAAARGIARAEYHRSAVIPTLEGLYERLLGEAVK